MEKIDSELFKIFNFFEKNQAQKYLGLRIELVPVRFANYSSVFIITQYSLSNN